MKLITVDAKREFYESRDLSTVGPSPSADLIDCTIEAYSLGDTVRALARARLKEIEPNSLIMVPFYFREICGPHVPWQSPQPGGAIPTTAPITSIVDAHRVLAWWATQTFAMNRRL